MTHSLGWKEMREVGKWSIYVGLVHLVAVVAYCGVAPRQVQSLEWYEGLGNGPIWVIFLSIGGLFGIFQTLAEATRDRLSLIHHRPMSAAHIFLTKWSIGAVGLSMAYVIPIAALTLWLTVPGVVPRPFWWPSLTVAAGHLPLILIAHAAGLFCGQHGPAWVLGRSLVLFTMYLTYFAFMENTQLIQVSWVLQQVLAALVLATVVIAAQTTYVTAGEPWTARSRSGRRVLTLLLVTGVSLALTVGLSLLDKFSPGNQKWQDDRQRAQSKKETARHWSISRTGMVGQRKSLTRDGHAFVEWTSITGQVQLEKTLSYEEIKNDDHSPLPPVDSPEAGGSIGMGWPAWPRWSWSSIDVADENADKHNNPRVDQPTSVFRWSPPAATHKRFHEVLMPSNQTSFYLWWYVGNRIVGFDRATNHCVGFLGPQGPQADPFLVQATDVHNTSKGFRSADGHYWEIQTGQNSDTLAPPACCPPPDTLNWDASSLSDSVRETVAVLPDRLLRLDRHGAVVEQIPLSKPLSHAQSWSVDWRRRQDGKASVIVVAYADHDVVFESNGHGQLLQSLDVPTLEAAVEAPAALPSSEMSITQVMSGLGLAPLLWVIGGTAETVGGVESVWGTQAPAFNRTYIPGMALGCAVGFLLVLYTARRRRLDFVTTIRWSAACLLLGICTPVALRELHRRHRVPCPSCNRMRLVEKPTCEHCAATWGTPAADGRELLDERQRA